MGVLGWLRRWLMGRGPSVPLALPAPGGGASKLPANAPDRQSDTRPTSSVPQLIATPQPAFRPNNRSAGPADIASAFPAGPTSRSVSRAFDFSHPVINRRDLFGRDGELEDLIDAALNQGQHVLVHGARGSGKTSMVRVFGDYADQAGAVVVYMACEPGADFADTLRPYLAFLPRTVLAGVGAQKFAQMAAELPSGFGPRTLVDLLTHVEGRPVIFILDEFDRVTDPTVVGEVAAFMKLLSDALSTVQVMLVGIGHSVGDVIAGHPSLRRHMHVTSLGRIDDEGVRRIMDAGAAATGLRFDADAYETIARAACGSPFHVRLFCRFTGLAAIRAGEAVAGQTHAVAGLGAAVTEWAKTNPTDVALFERLTTHVGSLIRLEEVARLAAYADLFDENALRRAGLNEADAAMLEPALVTDPRDLGKHLFRDSAAPQFLIALLLTKGYLDQRVPDVTLVKG